MGASIAPESFLQTRREPDDFGETWDVGADEEASTSSPEVIEGTVVGK